jgi:hypothetical protein
MSFGFGVGDLAAAAKLANSIRERLQKAPELYKEISSEFNIFASTLEAIEKEISTQDLAQWQTDALITCLEGCHKVLVDLGKIVDDFASLGPNLKNPSTLRDKARRLRKRFILDPEEIEQLRRRLTLQVNLLDACVGSLTR